MPYISEEQLKQVIEYIDRGFGADKTPIVEARRILINLEEKGKITCRNTQLNSPLRIKDLYVEKESVQKK